MREIIALGGGGFSMEPENPILDRYVLDQSPAGNPRICFLPTASGDNDDYIERFYEAFRPYDCRPSHLSLFTLPVRDPVRYLLEQDIIYVGGGNTRSMMALWREWGIDEALRRAWEGDVLLAGLSAGSICWFEEGLSDYLPDEYNPIAGLGLLAGSHSPHYDGEPERAPAYRRLIAEGTLKSGIAADDGVALHYRGTQLHRIVSSRPEARAWRVTCSGAEAVEEEVMPEYLGENQ